jgi:hypothetical protein
MEDEGKTPFPDVPLLPPSLWPALQRLADGAWPPAEDASATRFVEAAVQQGLLPLLLHEESCPPAVATALQRYRVWESLFRRRAEKLAGAVRDLAALLDPDPFVLLKGADYARRLYPEPTLRPMQDIDILVPAARFAAVCARLHEAGLVQRFEGSPTHRVAWFGESVFDLGDVTLEVHHSFLPRARHPIDYDAVWRRRVPVAGAGVAVARLDDVDALVYHALSLAKDEFFVRLARYVDFWLLLRTLSSLGPARERAREWRATHALFGALREVAHLFPELEERYPRPDRGLLTDRTSRFLERFVLPGREGLRVTQPRGRGLQIWRKFWLMDSIWRRLCFALHYSYAVASGSWVAWRAAAAPDGPGRPGPGATTT